MNGFLNHGALPLLSVDTGTHSGSTLSWTGHAPTSCDRRQVPGRDEGGLGDDIMGEAPTPTHITLRLTAHLMLLRILRPPSPPCRSCAYNSSDREEALKKLISRSYTACLERANGTLDDAQVRRAFA